MTTEKNETSPQEALKALRASRRETIAAAAARVKTQKKDLALLRSLLQGEEGLTVPELASGSGLKPPMVLWYVAALKKYGEILEGKKAGSYYRYRLAPVAASETRSPESDTPGTENQDKQDRGVKENDDPGQS